MIDTDTPVLEIEDGLVYRLDVSEMRTSLPYRFRDNQVLEGVRVNGSWLVLLPKLDGTFPGTNDGWAIEDQLAQFPALEARYKETHRGHWGSTDRAFPLSLVPHDPATEVLVTEIERLKQALTDQQRMTEVAVAHVDEAKEELERFKERVMEVGGQAAEEHDWCGTYESIMAELGLHGRSRERVVAVRFSFSQNITVCTWSDEEAVRIVEEDMSVVARWHPTSMLDGYEGGLTYDKSFEVIN